MPTKNGKLPEPVVEGDGIKVALSADEWILFQKDDWDLTDELYFQKANDFDSFKIIVRKSRDWRIVDKNGALIVFNRNELLAQIARVEAGERESNGDFPPLPRIPMQTQVPMTNAFYAALRETRNLPLPPRSTSTP